MNNIIHKTFAEIDLRDPFFQSLKNDYLGLKTGLDGKAIKTHLYNMKIIR